MNDFIEIRSQGQPKKLINIHQITNIAINKGNLRMTMSHGESFNIDMEHDEFVKLINVVSTIDEKPSTGDFKFLQGL